MSPGQIVPTFYLQALSYFSSLFICMTWPSPFWKISTVIFNKEYMNLKTFTLSSFTQDQARNKVTLGHAKRTIYQFNLILMQQLISIDSIIYILVWEIQCIWNKSVSTSNKKYSGIIIFCLKRMSLGKY